MQYLGIVIVVGIIAVVVVNMLGDEPVEDTAQPIDETIELLDTTQHSLDDDIQTLNQAENESTEERQVREAMELKNQQLDSLKKKANVGHVLYGSD